MSSPKENSDRSDVRSCYTNWSRTYFETYLGATALYPPVHVSLIDGLLREINAENILDAGCGPASMIRLLHNSERSFFGFDLTPAMIEEARKNHSFNMREISNSDALSYYKKQKNEYKCELIKSLGNEKITF